MAYRMHLVTNHAASSHVDVDNLAALRIITSPRLVSCRIRRDLAPELEDLLGERACRNGFDRRRTLRLDELDEHLGELLRPVRSRAIHDWLLEDMRSLATTFMQIVNAESCEARFESGARDGCRRFHHDYVPLRLLCTYVGPGTEWIADEYVESEALMALGGDIDAANRAIVRDGAAIRRASPYDVLLLKGARWPGHGRPGAVHRSPPIEQGSLVRRLLFKLDVTSER